MSGPWGRDRISANGTCAGLASLPAMMRAEARFSTGWMTGLSSPTRTYSAALDLSARIFELPIREAGRIHFTIKTPPTPIRAITSPTARLATYALDGSWRKVTVCRATAVSVRCFMNRQAEACSLLA
ncbi:Uncharacterised protein [Mycobacteroides abscessus subsp. massiliense]|nr:Uncharacterised protein [Mycobacteroides abscessus subsp. massiliense]